MLVRIQQNQTAVIDSVQYCLAPTTAPVARSVRVPGRVVGIKIAHHDSVVIGATQEGGKGSVRKIIIGGTTAMGRDIDIVHVDRGLVEDDGDSLNFECSV